MVRSRLDAEASPVPPGSPRGGAGGGGGGGGGGAGAAGDDATAVGSGCELAGLADNGGEAEDRRFAPSWCNNRLLTPLRCIFLGGGGSPPEMTARQWKVLSAVMVAGFFSHFDDDLLPLCLRQLQRTLSIPEAEVGLILSVVGVGKSGAAFMSILSDVLGRRRVFFVSVCVFCLLTLLTAFQGGIWGFAFLQMTARIFLAGKDSMANVYMVEETDPKYRGWVNGIYISVATTGGGVAVILFGIIGAQEDGWRYLYGLASLQLVFLAPLWHLLPDDRAAPGKGSRSEDLRRDALRRLSCFRRLTASVRSGLRPLRLLATSYPKRAAACLFVSANQGFSIMPSAALKIKHLQDTHGLSPAAVSGIVIGSGLVALAMFPMLGKMSDSGGRRTLLCVFMTVCPLGVIAFYNAPGNLYLPFYFLQMMGGFALNGLSTTFFAESFPESHRCTAQGMMMGFQVAGMTAGLATESLVYTYVGTHAKSVSLVILPAFLSPIIVRLCLPETAGKDLSEIAPEMHEHDDADDNFAQDDVKASSVGTPRGTRALSRKTTATINV